MNCSEPRLKHLCSRRECTGFGGGELALIEGGNSRTLCGRSRHAKQSFMQQKRTGWRSASRFDKTFVPAREVSGNVGDTRNAALPPARTFLLWRCRASTKLAAGQIMLTRCGMGSLSGRTCAATTVRWLYRLAITGTQSPFPHETLIHVPAARHLRRTLKSPDNTLPCVIIIWSVNLTKFNILQTPSRAR